LRDALAARQISAIETLYDARPTGCLVQVVRQLGNHAYESDCGAAIVTVEYPRAHGVNGEIVVTTCTAGHRVRLTARDITHPVTLAADQAAFGDLERSTAELHLAARRLAGHRRPDGTWVPTHTDDDDGHTECPVDAASVQ
jgi:hypothetical protein